VRLEQFRPPGHHPAAGDRRDARGAKGGVDLAAVLRGECPVPDRSGGDSLRRACEEHGFFVLRARTNGAGHRIDAFKEARQLQGLAHVCHCPTALRGEGLREPLRVADDVVHQDEFPDLVAADQIDGGGAPRESRGAEEGDLHPRIIPDAPRPVDTLVERLLP
jgi:hypothetical protein